MNELLKLDLTPTITKQSQLDNKGNARVSSLGSVFLNYIRQRIFTTPKNVIIVIVGEPGSGKSNAAIKILQKLNPELFLKRTPKEVIEERLCFTPEKFLKVIDEGGLKRGDVIIFDEGQNSINSRDWYSNTSKLLNKVLTTYRHRQLITIFTTPSLGFIDSQARKLVTLFVHCSSVNMSAGYNVARVYRFKYNALEDKYYPQKLRFIDNDDNTLKIVSEVRFSRLDPELEKAYKDVSHEFKRSVAKEAHSKLRKEVEVLKDKPLLNNIEKEIVKGKFKGLTIDSIADEIGLPVSKVKRIYHDLKKRGIRFRKKDLEFIVN